jgi:transcriptional regulator with PAS, ATPase and Fis domain
VYTDSHSKSHHGNTSTTNTRSVREIACANGGNRLRLSIFVGLADAHLGAALGPILLQRCELAASGRPVTISRQGAEGIVIVFPETGTRARLRPEASAQEIAAEVLRLAQQQSDEPRALAPSGPEPLAGESPWIQAAKREIWNAARSSSNVLITGETGTGKELVAQLIHQNSDRRNQPMVAINCAAIPDSLVESELFGYERGAFTGATVAWDGKLKQADRGTAFLDEIGDLSPFAQAKILRAIETGELQRLGSSRPVKTNVRMIAATNHNLEDAPGHEFRRDLFFRLSVIQIAIPPLRERMEDVPLLAAAFVEEFRGKFGYEISGVSPQMMSLLLRHAWPGNVRELRNVIEAAFVNCIGSTNGLLEMPERLARRIESAQTVGLPPPQAHAVSEQAQLLATLSSTNWNKAEAARRLRWSRMTLYRKLAKYHPLRESLSSTPPRDKVVTARRTG